MEDRVTINKGDMKQMWKCLKDTAELTNNKKDIAKIVINGQCIETEYDIVSIVEINDSIEKIPNATEFDSINAIETFKFINIELGDIIRITKAFKNKYGGKKLLSEGVFKDAMTYIAHLYKDIINESLNSGVVPSCWKISTIVHVEKVQNTVKPEELRPINTLSVDEKIMETVVKNQLVAHLDKHNVLIPEQSGFRKSHSSETALNMAIAEWKVDIAEKKLWFPFSWI